VIVDKDKESSVNTRLLLCLCAVALLWTNPAHAQLAAPGEAGVAMGHVHLVTRDVEASRRFFTTLGGTPVQKGPLQMIQFPGVFILLRQAEPTGGTVGSVINHFGFNVKDFESSVARWQEAGLQVEAGDRAGQAWLMTADDARIEILEDTTIEEPIRMHHVHWHVVDVLEVQAWYAKHFGAVPGTRGRFDAADLPGVNLTFAEVETVYPGTQGTALDHIGFEVQDLAGLIVRLEAAGITLDSPQRDVADGAVSIAYLTDPWGAYIELTEGLAP
jgi:catechol 2,3-dioxygenase-like lactoylglutathione lyase family enzyme